MLKSFFLQSYEPVRGNNNDWKSGEKFYGEHNLDKIFLTIDLSRWVCNVYAEKFLVIWLD
jgi:hypothetical protein